MKGIILAAGEGTRLRPYTLDRPKCMVELAGKSLLEHEVDALRAAGVEEVTVVTGYRADQIEALGLPTVHNPAYASTNMVASLMCARSLLDGSDSVVISYADIVYDSAVVRALCDCPAELCTTVDEEWVELWSARNEDPLADAETLRIDAAGDIIELGKKPTSRDQIEAQYMGLIKVGSSLAPTLVETHDALDADGLYDGKDLPNMYMTSFLQHLIDHGQKLRAVPVKGGWLEVDTAGDLELYREMLAEGRLSRFWRP